MSKSTFASAAEKPLTMRDGRAMIAVFEDHMQHRQFLVCDGLSVADFNAAPALDRAREAGKPAGAPRLQAFVGDMYARPKAPLTIAAAFAEQRDEMDHVGQP